MEVTVDWGDLEKNIVKCIADVEGPVRRKAGKTAGQNLGEKLENGEVLVGYGSEAYFRAHFPNMGTEYQAGQHFVEKTAETELESVMQDYMSELKRGLGL